VRVEVFAPSFGPLPSGCSGPTRIVDVPVASLADADGEGVYTGTFSFTESRAYRLVVHAQDGEGNLALPVMGLAWASADARRLYIPLLLRGY
jgi:hypothetical protein